MPTRATLLAAIAVIFASLAVACGGSDGVTTGTIAVGTTVRPEQYLADTRLAAKAIQDFAAVVNALPAPLNAPALKRSAAAMATPLADAQAAQDRLSAMRLEDQRLEAQRGRVRTANAAVIAAMGQVRNAALRGDMAATKTSAADLQTAITALRGLGGPATGG